MNELGIASSVRSLDLDVSLDHLNANVGCRCRCYGSGNARAHQEGCKVAPCDVSGMRLVARLAFLVVCHSFSRKEFIAFRWQTAPSDHRPPLAKTARSGPPSPFPPNWLISRRMAEISHSSPRNFSPRCEFKLVGAPEE